MAGENFGSGSGQGFGLGAAVLVLAGGQSRRMGRDKAGVRLGGQTLLVRMLALAGRTLPGAPVAVSWNGPGLDVPPGIPALPDTLPDHPGPLAGVLAGLIWARAIGCDRVLSLPIDAPFLPDDSFAQLDAMASPESPVLAQAGGRLHPTLALWPVSLAAMLERDLRAGERRVARWAGAQGARVVDFPDADAFANLNTPEDLTAAEGRLSGGFA